MDKSAAYSAQPDNAASARDHLANERTFLAWLRTGVAVAVFGFAIGRFAIAIQEFTRAEDLRRSAGISVWLGLVLLVYGIILVLAGLMRYRRTCAQLEAGKFEPAGLLTVLVAISTVVFGLVLAAYLMYISFLR